jgi:hypothetical protein
MLVSMEDIPIVAKDELGDCRYEALTVGTAYKQYGRAMMRFGQRHLPKQLRSGMTPFNAKPGGFVQIDSPLPGGGF